MSFVFPGLLALLVFVPVLVAVYVMLVRRRARRVAELAAQGFAPTSAAQRLRRRRHVPFAFFLAGLTLALVAMARPQADVSLPKRQGTVILAFDVSNSMKADDLKPTRIAAAKKAATAFVARQPATIRIGVVAFSDGALTTLQPTTDKKAVVAAIKRLTPQGGTSLAQGIFTSLNAIAGKPLAISPEAIGSLDSDTPSDLKIGYYGSAAVVLLTDGQNTGGADPANLAKLAALAGVKVHTIGIGSTAGTVVKVQGFSVATALDEALLKQIAKTTNGTYFAASDAAALTKVYSSIKLQTKYETKKTEITGAVSAAGMALLVIGAGLSLVLFGRVV